MPLASLHQFIRVEAFFAAHFCRFDALTIHNADTRFRISPGFGPYIAAE
jgi:hypothetical protein